MSENAPSVEAPILHSHCCHAGLVGKSATPSPAFLERLALLAVILRVFMVIAWGPISTVSPELSALKLQDLAVVLVMAICFLILSVRVGRWRLVGCLALALGVAVMCLSAVLSHSDVLMIDLLVVFAVSFVEPRKLCKTYATVALVSISAVMLLSVAGVVSMRDVIPNGRLVFSYGFGHPNSLGGLLLSALGALTYVYWDRKQWAIPLVLTVVAAIFAKVALSSNSSAALLAVVAFVNIVGHVGAARWIAAPLRKIQVPLLILVPTILGFVMLLLTANHEGCGALADIVDGLTHSRPHFASQYYAANGGFTLFGRPYAHLSSYHSGLAFAAVDCSYSYMSLVNGIASLLVCFGAYVTLVIRSREGRVHPFVVTAILIYAVYGVTEGFPMHFYANFTLLLLAGLGRTTACHPPRSRDSR